MLKATLIMDISRHLLHVLLRTTSDSLLQVWRVFTTAPTLSPDTDPYPVRITEAPNEWECEVCDPSLS